MAFGNILQRRRLALAMLCVCLLLGLGFAQSRARKPREKGPRALALVEWPATGTPRLVPVAILVDGRYYDAGIYKASPVPMALDSGTVYEVEQSGESVGFFTVYDAKEIKDNWFGEGQWQSHEAIAARRKAAAEAAAASAAAAARAQAEADRPPTLRRGGPESPKPQTSPAPTTPAPAPVPPADRGPDEPPVLRRPSAPEPTATTPSPPAAPAQNPSASAPAAAPARDQGDDSGRPVLRRGAPRGVSQAASLPGSVIIPSGAQPTSVPSAAARVAVKGTGSTGVTRVLPAISDAGGPEPRPFSIELSPPEQQRLTGLIKAMASGELESYAKAHPTGPRPGGLEDVQVRSFDLSFSNSPLLLLTAHAGVAPAAAPPSRASRRGTGRSTASEAAAGPAPQAAQPGKDFSFYVTVVAREDLNGDLRQLMASTTDSNHLDAFSRLELIDAVDADGDGRGELLFREISDTGSNFVLYRVGPDNLTALFNSAELER